MHASSEKGLVENRVQGQCIINGIIYWSVNIMHALEIDPTFGFYSFGSMDSLQIWPIHPRYQGHGEVENQLGVGQELTCDLRELTILVRKCSSENKLCIFTHISDI